MQASQLQHAGEPKYFSAHLGEGPNHASKGEREIVPAKSALFSDQSGGNQRCQWKGKIADFRDKIGSSILGCEDIPAEQRKMQAIGGPSQLPRAKIVFPALRI